LSHGAKKRLHALRKDKRPKGGGRWRRCPAALENRGTLAEGDQKKLEIEISKVAEKRRIGGDRKRKQGVREALRQGASRRGTRRWNEKGEEDKKGDRLFQTVRHSEL